MHCNANNPRNKPFSLLISLSSWSQTIYRYVSSSKYSHAPTSNSLSHFSRLKYPYLSTTCKKFGCLFYVYYINFYPLIFQWRLHWLCMFFPTLQIREKALGILELGLKLILLAQQDVIPQLLSDLKGVSACALSYKYLKSSYLDCHFHRQKWTS